MTRRRTAVCLAAVVALAVVLWAGVCLAQEAKTFPVSGKVLTPDGSPAAGALVDARSSGSRSDWTAKGTATCDADGKFTMQLAKGSYVFCAVSGTLVHSNDYNMIEVKDGSPAKPIELRLEKGCKVEGSVVDKSNGQPVGGVRILSRTGDHAESSDSGEWSMVVRPGNHAITAVREGYWWPITNFVASGDSVKVKVETKPGGTIKGRVLKDDGQPAANVWVGTENSGYFSLYGSRADAEGRFALHGHDPDSKVKVWVSAKGYDDPSDLFVTFPAGKREAEIEIKLTKTKVRAITGRVTRQDGSPVEGAKVAYGLGPNYVDYVTANTDKDGNYTLKEAGVRKSLLLATARGMAPVCKAVEADKDQQVDFQMKPGHTVEGRVEDEDGNPLAGAGLSVSIEVSALKDVHGSAPGMDNLYGSISSVSTDKDGRFRIESLPEGFVYADVYAKDRDRLNNERLKVDRKDYTLVLRKTKPTARGHICGTVVKESDGKPVTEFSVRLDFSRRGGRSSGLSPGLNEQGVSVQDADGKFSIAGLTVKEGFRVVVTAPGYMEASIDPVMVKPTSEQPYKDAVFRLRPAKLFQGSVTEAGTDRPVDGVVVTAWNTGPYGSNVSFQSDMSRSSMANVSARTGADGKFGFDSMPFPSGAIMLEKPGFARTLLRGVSFSRPLQASMEKGATITGSIADEQGNVSSSSWIKVEQVDLKLEFRAQISPDGSFKAEDLPPGDYMVLVYRDSRSTRHTSFELKAGETHEVAWSEQGAVVVEGKVTQNGKPVAKAGIGVNAQRGGQWAGMAETGPDGSYKLSLLKPGAYLFTCDLGEWGEPDHIYTCKTLQLAAGTSRADFKLPCGSISGRLVDKRTGEPLAGMSVRMYISETYEQNKGRLSLHFAAADPTWWSEGQCKTDKNGAFQVKNLKAGKWLICAAPAGSRGIPAAVVKLAEGEARTGVVAKVPPTGSAKISFAGMEAMPKTAMVGCVDECGMLHYPEYKEGVYTAEIRDLPVGKLRAVSQSNDYLPVQVPFEVRADETTGVSMKLTKGPRVVFRATSGSGEVDGAVSIGFRITTPDGKPVLRGLQGPVWGEIIGLGIEQGKPAGVMVKPGTYLIKAGAVTGDARSYGEEPELTGFSGTVTVVEGKDAVVEVPLQR